MSSHLDTDRRPRPPKVGTGLGRVGSRLGHARSRLNARNRYVRLALAAGLVLAAFLIDSAAASGTIRPNVRVGDLELGGMTAEEAEETLTERAERLAAEPVTFTVSSEELVVGPDEVGFFPEVETTVSRAMAVGRDGNPVFRAWDRLRTYFSETDVGWASTLSDEAAGDLVTAWKERFDDPHTEAGIEAQGTSFVAVEGQAGQEIDRDAALRTIRRGFEAWPRRPVPLPISSAAPKTDLADAESAAERAAELIRAPITLVGPDGGTAELSPEDLAPLLEAVPEEGDDDWSLVVRFSPTRVDENIGSRMEPFEQESRDADFRVSGNSVSIAPSENGLAFDPEETAGRLDEVARRDAPRETEAAMRPVEADFTTAEAEALNIHEQVSSFTTNHSCCQPRVENIHIFADIVDGALVAPGQTFSLNQYVGRRTESRGFEPAPTIYDGEYVDTVGGGVSQFATTFFNAVFFGGYQDVYHKAHSYYISRYPKGREATISYPAPDLKFRNNSSSGILIKTFYSSTSITVAFYGDDGGKEVSASQEEPTNFKDPPVERRANPALAPGAERVVQSGSQGFDVVVYRIITHPDGHTERERFFTRYKPEPRIVEYGPATPAPSPSPEPSPGETPGEDPEQTPEPTPEPSPGDGEGSEGGSSSPRTPAPAGSTSSEPEEGSQG